MGSNAREQSQVRAGAASAAPRRSVVRAVIGATAAFALLVALLVVVAAGFASAAEAAPAPSPRSMTDAQLAAEVARHDADAATIGRQLLAADAERDVISRDRDVAVGLLARFLADSYKRTSTEGGLAQQLLTAESLAEATDRVRISDAIGDYHASVLRSLDDARSRLDVTAIERAQLITRLTNAQRRLVPLQEEQSRRAVIRAQVAARREREAAATAAAAAQKQRDADRAAGQLVAASGLGAAGATAFAAPGGPPSAALIDAYLASKGSPMAGQGAAFMASGARWRVDPRLLVAIAGAESSFGAVTCGPNNAWGWACPNNPADFATWADGIDTVMEGLRRYYLDEGRTSVSLIQQKYCPVGAANDPTGLNHHWTGNVTKFLVELGGNPANVGPGPSGAAAIGIPDFGLVAAD